MVCMFFCFFFFKQKTAYEMRIRDGSSDVCSSDLAVRTLRLAREAGGWTLVKLEVLGEAKTLYPDMVETLRATEVLAKEGFQPMVYCADDPIAAKRLEDAGAVAIMPLGAPIGSGLGIQIGRAHV